MKKLLILVALVLVCLLTSCSMLGNLADGVTGGDDSLEYTQEESQQKMDELAESDGYYIEYKFTDEDGSSGTMKFGDKGGTFWYTSTDDESDNDSAAFTVDSTDNKTVYFYEYDTEAKDFKFQGATKYTSDDYDPKTLYKLGYSLWLYYGYVYNGMLTKKGSTKVCGRACTEYEFNLGASLGVLSKLGGIDSYKYIIAVDNELGLTMKLTQSIKADGETATLSFEVVKFQTGNDVKVPTLPEPPACVKPGFVKETGAAEENHLYGEWDYYSHPSCELGGEAYRYCSACGYKDEKTLPPTGHKWDEWSEWEKPTCINNGQERRCCSECWEAEFREVEKTGKHVFDCFSFDHEWSTDEEAGYISFWCVSDVDCEEERVIELPVLTRSNCTQIDGTYYHYIVNAQSIKDQIKRIIPNLEDEFVRGILESCFSYNEDGDYFYMDVNFYDE